MERNEVNKCGCLCHLWPFQLVVAIPNGSAREWCSFRPLMSKKTRLPLLTAVNEVRQATSLLVLVAQMFCSIWLRNLLYTTELTAKYFLNFDPILSPIPLVNLLNHNDEVPTLWNICVTELSSATRAYLDILKATLSKLEMIERSFCMDCHCFCDHLHSCPFFVSQLVEKWLLRNHTSCQEVKVLDLSRDRTSLRI